MKRRRKFDTRLPLKRQEVEDLRAKQCDSAKDTRRGRHRRGAGAMRVGVKCKFCDSADGPVCENCARMGGLDHPLENEHVEAVTFSVLNDRIRDLEARNAELSKYAPHGEYQKEQMRQEVRLNKEIAELSARAETAEARVKELEQDLDTALGQHDAWAQTARDAEARVAKLEAALRWYATAENYRSGCPGAYDKLWMDQPEWVTDDGEIARQALAPDDARHEAGKGET